MNTDRDQAFGLIALITIVQTFMVILKWTNLSNLTWAAIFIPAYIYFSIWVGAFIYTFLQAFRERRLKKSEKK